MVENNAIVKIVALGGSGSGKTSYLATLYGEMDGGIEVINSQGNEVKYSINCIKDDDRRFLLDQHEMLQKGEDIESTNKDKQYFIEMFRKEDGNRSSIISFYWKDYCGEDVLNENMQNREMEKSVKEADCLVVFIDGRDLENIESENRLGNISGRMKIYLQLFKIEKIWLYVL